MTHVVEVSSLYVRVGQVLKIPCERIEITERFIAYSILMNAAVNIYHLRKTFCGKTAGKFVVAVQRNCWRTRYYTKIRKNNTSEISIYDFAFLRRRSRKLNWRENFTYISSMESIYIINILMVD
jgi:hypothetical protein